MNIMTPDEEVELLNHLVGLLDQIDLVRRVPSDWNKKSLREQEKDMNHRVDVWHKRMKRLNEQLRKAS